MFFLSGLNNCLVIFLTRAGPERYRTDVGSAGSRSWACGLPGTALSGKPCNPKQNVEDS